MALNIEFIHNTLTSEIESIFGQNINLIREGSSFIDPPSPRLSYLPIKLGVSPFRSILKSPDLQRRVVVYEDFVYDDYRYNIIVDDTVSNRGRSPTRLLVTLSSLFSEAMRSITFKNALETIATTHSILSGFNEVIVPMSTQSERRFFMDVRYGFVNSWAYGEDDSDVFTEINYSEGE